jgi:hypothetical protein
MAEMNVPQATTGDALCNPETNLGLPSFCDRRVFAVSLSYCDQNIARIFSPDDFSANQNYDGPRFITVGGRVLDERLERNLPELSGRYGVTLAHLKSARSDALVQL